ncbi:MAG: hypothetical protein GX465_18635 [Acidobacteria bacterium]|nr:hypothetical protein [Acidobacteriota bacterium]
MRKVIAVVSDTHGGHRLGLLNPETVLYEEDAEGNLTPYTPKLTATQTYLWDLYLDTIAEVRDYAGDDMLILIHNGDITQGVRYPEHLVSTRLADQITIGTQNLRPWFLLADVRWARLSKGTGSHVLGEGSSEIMIAEQLSALFPDADIQAVYHGLLDVDGVEVDYAHHGPYPGSRAWLRGNVARYDLRSMMLDVLSSGKTPPRVVLRAHYHQWIPPETLGLEFMGEMFWSTLALTPSFCGMGSHGHQATRSTAQQTHGMITLEIVDGRLGEIRAFKRSMDLRTKEQI